MIVLPTGVLTSPSGDALRWRTTGNSALLCFLDKKAKERTRGV